MSLKVYSRTRHSDPDPREVIYAMRELKRAGCYMSHISRAACNYAVDNGLIEYISWPAGFYRITPAGCDYIAENSEGGDDD